MATKRPHVQSVRLTTSQYELLKLRIAQTPGVTIQKVLAVAVNAYIRSDFDVHADGSYTLAEPGIISEVDDADALDLTSLDEADDGPEVWGTRELAEHAAKVTGHSVSVHLLRELLREEYPKPEGATVQARYRFQSDDPAVQEIIGRIREGVLDEIRERRFRSM